MSIGILWRVIDSLNVVILVGDAGTGKTNIVYCFTRDKIPNNIMPTIAVEFSSKLVTLDNRETVKTQIWDTAGQETYRSLTMRYSSSHPGTAPSIQLLPKNARSHHRLWRRQAHQLRARSLLAAECTGEGRSQRSGLSSRAQNRPVTERSSLSIGRRVRNERAHSLRLKFNQRSFFNLPGFQEAHQP